MDYLLTPTVEQGVLCWFCCVSHLVQGVAAGIYESFWACNMALLTVAYGMIMQSSTAISAGLAMVVLAHLLWNIDFLTYCATGKFPIGNAKYLKWRSVGLFETFTTLHHAWFIPLCFFVLYGNGRLDREGLILSWVISIISGLLCRLFPKEINVHGKTHYLNVNMAHEFWKDIHVSFLHHFNPPRYPWMIYFVWMICLLNLINTAVYCIVSFVWDLIVP
eukprot:TRINITY_DN1749_c0_g1_i1.p1 TRINITY_DN1749_c0_g1~~TRINITY_DN1749_c0_g1_i1.p1  ORF type:complete len:219 (-),score=27.76 TRINITY_DN1749_c0_g1_i1:262-918(-)